MKITTFGEIMMRLTASNNDRLQKVSNFDVSYAGSEANVAVDLSYWGLNSTYITSLPKSEIGESVLLDLQSYRVNTNYIKNIDNERLGILFLEPGSNQKPSKVIYDRTDSSFARDQFKPEFFQKALKNKNWFHWSGITAGINSNAVSNIQNALKVAEGNKLTISCDLNYRGKLWQYGKHPNEIMPGLLQNTKVIIGNEEDASIMLNLKSNKINAEAGKITANSFKPICSEIFMNYPNCEIVCFSIRESKSANHNNWSAILATRASFYISNKYEIKNIVDRVGAGDSFSAGIIYGLNVFKTDYQKVLEFATAASCLKHSIKGDYCIVSTAEIKKLMDGNTSGRINR